MGGTKCISLHAFVQSPQPSHLARSMTITHFWFVGATDLAGKDWRVPCAEVFSEMAREAISAPPVPCKKPLLVIDMTVSLCGYCTIIFMAMSSWPLPHLAIHSILYSPGLLGATNTASFIPSFKQ